VEELRGEVKILEVLMQYIDVKKIGHLYKCKCPFHDETEPSLVIYEKTNSFYCFGCKKSGDVFTFIELLRNCNFREAAESVASFYGYTLVTGNQNIDKAIKEALKKYNENENLNKKFKNNLKNTKNNNILNYLNKRNINDTLINLFEIGFCYEGLFNNRITFPIYNKNGKIAGFGGRTILEKRIEPKYLNSQEDNVFKKRELLYGLHVNKKNITLKKSVIIVEGYFDVIHLYKLGYNNVVAVLGTSLTTNHIDLLEKLGVEEITLMFDGDKAGLEATFKSLKTLLKYSIDTKIVVLQGKDPAELSLEELQQNILKSINAIDFVLQKFKKGVNFESIKSKEIYVKKCISFFETFNNTILKDLVINKLAKILHIDVEALKNFKLNSNIEKTIKYAKSQYVGRIEESIITVFILFLHTDFIREQLNELTKDIFKNLFVRKLLTLLKSNKFTNENELKKALSKIEQRKLDNMLKDNIDKYKNFDELLIQILILKLDYLISYINKLRDELSKEKEERKVKEILSSINSMTIQVKEIKKKIHNLYAS
jgi:DNA primase